MAKGNEDAACALVERLLQYGLHVGPGHESDDVHFRKGRDDGKAAEGGGLQQRLQRRHGVVQQRNGADVLALVHHIVSSLVVHTVVPLVEVRIVVHFDQLVVQRCLSKGIRCPFADDANNPDNRGGGDE